jgi:hypothetical protein
MREGKQTLQLRKRCQNRGKGVKQSVAKKRRKIRILLEHRTISLLCFFIPR